MLLFNLFVLSSFKGCCDIVRHLSFSYPQLIRQNNGVLQGRRMGEGWGQCPQAESISNPIYVLNLIRFQSRHEVFFRLGSISSRDYPAEVSVAHDQDGWKPLKCRRRGFLWGTTNEGILKSSLIARWRKSLNSVGGGKLYRATNSGLIIDKILLSTTEFILDFQNSVLNTCSM